MLLYNLGVNAESKIRNSLSSRASSRSLKRRMLPPQTMVACYVHVGFVAAMKSPFATRQSGTDSGSSVASNPENIAGGEESARERHMFPFMRAVAPPPSVHASGGKRDFPCPNTLQRAEHDDICWEKIVMNCTCSWLTSPWTQLPRQTRLPSRRQQAPATRR